MPKKREVRNERRAEYPLEPVADKDAEEQVLALAAQILESRIRRDPVNLVSSRFTRQYVRTKLASKEREVFMLLVLDNQHRLIAAEELFLGTIDGATVHPREVVRCCLQLNGAAVIAVHNHPSGVAEPSQADIGITRRLKAALALIDVRVLDHLVVGESEVVSLAERGLL